MSDSDLEVEEKKDETRKFTDNNEYILFGTPIELDEVEMESGKKIMRKEDQIATDEKGRRRFHGAFTGGFSAGFFNTCGSKSGFIPSAFVSSRSARADKHENAPETFMDEEDFGEFGIAPRKYTTTQKFNDKTPKIVENIRDDKFGAHAVLKDIIPESTLINSLNIVVKQTIGYELLKKMGWKEGKGFGALQFIPKTFDNQLNNKGLDSTVKNDKKIYTCALPPHLIKKQNITLSDYNISAQTPSSSINNNITNNNLNTIAHNRTETNNNQNISAHDRNIIQTNDTLNSNVESAQNQNLYKNSNTIDNVNAQNQNNKNNDKNKFARVLPTENDIKIPDRKSDVFGIGFQSLRIESERLKPKVTETEFKPTGHERSGIRGSAYGIGVFDEHSSDDDIYHADSITNYDFSIEPTLPDDDRDNINNDLRTTKKWQGFLKAKSSVSITVAQYNLPVIPEDYRPEPNLGGDVSGLYAVGAKRVFTSGDRSKLINKNNNNNNNINLFNNDDDKYKSLKSRFVSSGQSHASMRENPLKPYITAAQSNNFGKLTRISEKWVPNDTVCKRFNIVCIAHAANSLAITKPKTDNIVFKPNLVKNSTVARAVSVQGPLSVLNTDFESAQTQTGVVNKGVSNISSNTNIHSFSNINKNIINNNNDKNIDNLNVNFSNDNFSDNLDRSIVNNDNNQETETDSFEKPSLDLFKAVFCDESDDELEKVTKEKRKNEEINTTIKKIRFS